VARPSHTGLALTEPILDRLYTVYSVQRDWNQLFREFVADIRGEGYSGYPTFRHGSTACEVIDIVRHDVTT
jgi:hypothetical protein